MLRMAGGFEGWTPSAILAIARKAARPRAAGRGGPASCIGAPEIAAPPHVCDAAGTATAGGRTRYRLTVGPTIASGRALGMPALARLSRSPSRADPQKGCAPLYRAVAGLISNQRTSS